MFQIFLFHHLDGWCRHSQKYLIQNEKWVGSYFLDSQFEIPLEGVEKRVEFQARVKTSGNKALAKKTLKIPITGSQSVIK